MPALTIHVPRTVWNDWAKQRIRLHNRIGWTQANERFFKTNFMAEMIAVGIQQTGQAPPNQLADPPHPND